MLSVMNSMPETALPSRSKRTAARSAFTLVELMIAVAIIGVLAVLAIMGFRKYLNAAHSSEAINIIGAIKAAQESYRAETLSYLNVSTTLDTFYPRADPNDRKMAWANPSGSNYDKWRILNVDTGGPVLYSFATISGLPNQAVPTGAIKTVQKPNFPTAPVEPWYLIQAVGDVDDDNVNFYAIASSFSADVYIENDDE